VVVMVIFAVSLSTDLSWIRGALAIRSPGDVAAALLRACIGKRPQAEL
jgi:hypothetical protein